MVIFSLTRALKKMGVDCQIFMPKYGSIDEKKYKMEIIFEGLRVPTGKEGESLVCNVKKHISSESGVPVYFLENMEYYEKRSNIYGYSDDPTRFTLLSRGVLEFFMKSNQSPIMFSKNPRWLPEIINCADWHTGALPNYLKTVYEDEPILNKIKTVFSIHNLIFQGVFDHHFVSQMDFDDGKSPIAPFFSEKLEKQNFMRRGIIYSDIVNTVSETYAQEIMTPEYGEKLDELLREMRTKVFGILNGLDYEKINPTTDKKQKSASPDDFVGK